MDIFWKKVLFLLVFLFGIHDVCLATSQPVVSLSISNSEAKKGDIVTINATINNGDTKELQDTVLSLDLPVEAGLSFISSSQPVEWSEDSRPMWRLGIVGAGMADQVSISIRLNSDFAGSGLDAQALVSGNINNEKVQVYSNSVNSVLVAESKVEEKSETKENDQSIATNEKSDTEKTADNGKVEGLKATAAEKIDVKSLAGIADLSKYNNINRWDGRFLVVGVVAFVLVLVVGLLAFFMGRKSK